MGDERISLARPFRQEMCALVSFVGEFPAGDTYALERSLGDAG